MTDLLVIHDVGASGGAEWAEAFAAWPGTVHAPDLPGHGTAPAPVGGHYELGDAVFAVAPLLEGPARLVVGVGANGHAARMIALGGRAAGLVLVDGLGGPWLEVPARHAALRELRGRILATPAALTLPPPGSLDVRATMVLGMSDRDHVVRVSSHITVPTLVVESPSSPTPDAEDIVAVFPSATLVAIAESTPAAVAEVVTDWWCRSTSI